MNVKLYIRNGDTIYEPATLERITWSTCRNSSPGELSFEVIQDEQLHIEEGNAVQLFVDGIGIFSGFLFGLEQDKDAVVKCKAYDQLRYLKNKDTYCYVEKKASDLVRMIAGDFQLQTGEIEDTGYVIPFRTESNQTLFDIIQNALDLTLMNQNTLYILYDDFGKLALKNMENMKLNLLLTKESAENFSYTSSIDSDVYNQVKLTFDNEKTGKREVYLTKDSSNIEKWGVLQYYDTLKEGENGKAKADVLLELYNKKQKSLKVKGVFGEVQVRAGCSIGVQLDLGDISLKNYMVCDKVTHTFQNQEHTMEFTLIGGDFRA